MTTDLAPGVITKYQDEPWSAFLALFIFAFSPLYLCYTPWAGSIAAALRKKYMSGRSKSLTCSSGYWQYLFPIWGLATIIFLFIVTYHLNTDKGFQEGPQQTAKYLAFIDGDAPRNITMSIPFETNTTEQTRDNYNAFRTWSFLTFLFLFLASALFNRFAYTNDTRRMVYWSAVLVLLAAHVFIAIAIAAIFRYPNYGAEFNRTHGYKNPVAIRGVIGWFLLLAILFPHTLYFFFYYMSSANLPDPIMGTSARVGAKANEEELSLTSGGAPKSFANMLQ